MYVMFMLTATGGLIITAQLKPIAKDFGIADSNAVIVGLTVAALPFALSMNRILNGVSRPFFGWLSDKFGRERTMCVAFLIEALGFLMLGRMGANPAAFVLLTGLVFFAYGEIYSLFPAACADSYGRQYASANAGLLYTAKARRRCSSPQRHSRRGPGGMEQVSRCSPRERRAAVLGGHMSAALAARASMSSRSLEQAIGYLGGWLVAAEGEDVTFIARGANLEAIRSRGMKVIGEDGKEVVATNVRAFSSMAEAGPQDVVLLTVKAHQVADVAGDLKHLCHDDTAIVTMQNGIPWWYFLNYGGQYGGHAVRAADPDGSINRQIDPDRIIGTVVYPAAVLEAPDVVRVVEGRRFSIGELTGKTTPRIQTISDALSNAGFKAPVIDDIRGEIWLKIWGNLSFNPISALTHTTLVELLQYPLTRELCVEMMREAEAVAHKLGITFRVGIDNGSRGASRRAQDVDAQDVEAGKPPRSRRSSAR